jgi:hypothetical protein
MLENTDEECEIRFFLPKNQKKIGDMMIAAGSACWHVD